MKKIGVLITSCENGVLGEVGCHFSPSGSNNKNKNNSPMLIPILFPEVIIIKCIVIVLFRTLCIQFSQLNDYTSSEVALKSEVTAHPCIGVSVHRYETVSVDVAKPSTLSPSEMTTGPKLKT